MNVNARTRTWQHRMVPYAVVATATLAALTAGVALTTTTHAEPQATASTAQQQVATPIAQRYASDATYRQVLGLPIGAEQQDLGISYQNYQNGRAYYIPTWDAVYELHGQIYNLYVQYGAHAGLGLLPGTDERTTPDGKGKYNHLYSTDYSKAGSIYWTAQTGAHLVKGNILSKWAATGWERGPLGYPTTDQATAVKTDSQYNNFQQGSIYSSPQYGERYVVGEIYKKWGQYRYDAGFLGKPMTDETKTPDGKGRYNVFEGGSVYWSAASGAHSIGGKIRDGWAAIGWERSWLGYPTSDEYNIPGGKGQDFQGGYIRWTPQTGVVAYRR